MPRLAFSKYLLAASSALALTLGSSVAARASNVVANPVDPIPPIAAGHITQEASADVKIFVNYDAQIQNSFASHTISAGLRVRFN
jgi:hypothetical protein